MCGWDGSQHACSERPICGRPFVVDGGERVAPLASGDGWLAERLARLPASALDPEDRRAVAAHYAEAGLMEHASVAAFARFALQLLALGAPSELVAETSRAMADETRHAEVCFGLARRYGLDAAPGPLDVGGVLGEVSLERVLDLVVIEGCIGESGAALEAAWASGSATEPVVREALGGIAEDEARHAALAFRFVAWAASRHDWVLPRVRCLVAAAVLGGEAGGGAEEPVSPARQAHGVLDLPTRRLARRVALLDVIPAALASLAAAPAASRSAAITREVA
jgi:hypothetical protein